MWSQFIQVLKISSGLCCPSSFTFECPSAHTPSLTCSSVHSSVNECPLWLLLPQSTQLWMDVLHCPTKFVWEWVAFSALVHSAAIECMPAVTSIGPVHLAAKEWLQFPLFTQLWMECLSLAPIAQTDSTANDCLLWLSLPQFTQLWLTTTSALFCPHSRRCDCLGLPLTQFTQLWMSTFSCLYSPCSGRCECYLWPPFPDLLTCQLVPSHASIV